MAEVIRLFHERGTMTYHEVEEHGFTLRSERGDPAKCRHLGLESERRFRELKWMFVARGMNLRTAHRRWKRRNGLPLK